MMDTGTLTKAIKRLQPEQGMVARRNARTAVLTELRRLRRQLDEEYPCIRRKAKPHSKRKAAKRRAELEAQFVRVPTWRAVQIAALGVKVLSSPARVPKWTEDCKTDAEVKRCLKEPNYRKVLSVRTALTES